MSSPAAPSLSPNVPPGPPAPAPLRWRALALGGVGALLALPAVLAAVNVVRHQDRAGAAAAAQTFLDALHDGDAKALQPLLAVRTDAGVPLLPGAAHLRLPLLRAQIDRVVVQGNNASVDYTLSRVEGPVELSLTGPLSGVSVMVDARENQSAPRDFPAGKILGALEQKAIQSQVQAAREAADRLAGQKGVLILHRSGDRWYALGTIFPRNERGEGPKFTWEQAAVNFEEPAAFRAFRELSALGPGRGESSWQVDLDIKDVSAGTVLQEQARELGVPLAALPQSLPALSKPVSFRLRGASRLEAIEEVCRQAGVQVRYGPGSLQVGAGRRAGALAFVGPFLVEATEVKEFPPQATGALKLRCVAGRPIAPIVKLLGPGAVTWRIDAVTAADGRDLYHAANQPFFQSLTNRGTREQGGAVLCEEGRVVPLRNLLRDLDAIHRVRGRLVVPLPVRVDTIRLDHLAPGVTGQEGDARLTVRTIRQADPGSRAGPPTSTSQPGRTVIELDAEGIGGRRLLFAAYDGLGKALECGPADTSRPDLARVEVPGDPATLVLKAVSFRDVEYAFELRDVPLARPPRRLEPPRFAGHEAPVSVDFLGIVREADRPVGLVLPFTPRKLPGVSLRLSNHSQKDVERLDLKLTYLDAAGRPVREVARTVTRFNELESRLNVIEPGKPFEVADEGLPAGAVKATVAVTRVGFTDGTAWPP